MINHQYKCIFIHIQRCDGSYIELVIDKRNWWDVDYKKKHLSVVSAKELYKLYTNILPKKKEWLRYVKGKKTMKYQRWLLEIVAKYYESSISEAHDYLEIYYSSEQGKADLKSILQKYGIEPKEIKKLNLP